MVANFALVCSAAGTDLGECLKSIGTHLATVETNDVSVVNLGDHIGVDYRTLMARPMPEIFTTLNSAARSVVTSLKSSRQSTILGCHLTLYDARSQVFHSALHMDSFIADDATVAPDRVILLIDDIYDMLDRLGQPGDIFDRARLSAETLENLKQAARRSHGEIKWLFRIGGVVGV